MCMGIAMWEGMRVVCDTSSFLGWLLLRAHYSQITQYVDHCALGCIRM